MSLTRPISEILRGHQLVSVDPGMSVRDAAQLMAKERIGALPVVREGRLIGIFTERDALVRVLARGLDPEKTPLSEVMTADPVTIDAGPPLQPPLQMIIPRRFLPVPVP